MRKFIGAVIILLAAWGVWELYVYWTGYRDSDPALRKSGTVARGPLGEMDGVMDMQSGNVEVSQPIVPSSQMEGLPKELDPLLQNAQRKGAAGLRAFLKDYGKLVKDPRLAAIQLDYVVAVALEDPVEARRVFAEVKQRTPAASPVYPRIKSLEKTYQ